MLEQEHFQHYDNNSTYITKQDWPKVDALIDWIIEKNRQGYKMVNSDQASERYEAVFARES